MVTLFWAFVLLIIYPYVFYPVAIAFLARVRPRTLILNGRCISSVAFVMAARNEGARIKERVIELIEQLDVAQVQGQIIVVLDGPDNPLPLPPTIAGRQVEVIVLPQNQGKSAAITAGSKIATCEVLAFADVRQSWRSDALKILLENFRDPQVGAVSGELILQTPQGINSGVSLYWQYEKWLRYNEGTTDSVVGVTGSICAVRRELFDGVPSGTLLDDVYWPLTVVMRGFRVIHDRRAQAFDRLPTRPQDEFRRKVRTLCGNFQLLQRLPSALLPWRNRIWLQTISHKMLRLVVPWALCGVLITSGAIASPPFQWLFWAQIGACGMLGLVVATGMGTRFRAVSAGTSFALLNLAAWIAFWVWLCGSAGKTWVPVRYDDEIKISG